MRVIELRLQNNDENYVKMLRYKLAYISKDIVNISEEGASLHVHIEGDKFEEIEAALKRLVDELMTAIQELLPISCTRSNPKIRFRTMIFIKLLWIRSGLFLTRAA